MSVSTFLLRIGFHYCVLIMVSASCIPRISIVIIIVYWCNLLFVFAYIVSYLCHTQLHNDQMSSHYRLRWKFEILF
ncbi:hypothetical protein V1515DRAFT_591906 [Lipomyces mesembrius]